MNYYDKIKERLIKSEIYDMAKDYAKNRNKVKVYFEIGKLLSDAGKEYGKNIIGEYSKKLMVEVGKKYNERNLRYMRQFYEMIIMIKWNPLGSKLSWSHYREVLSLKNINEIKYYINVCEKNNLSKRQLQERIKTHEYNRLSDEAKSKMINKEPLNVSDLVPNPIVIKHKFENESISEYALKESILNNLDDFLKELGDGFTYVSNEYKIKLGNSYNYIDLLLFNYEYNCFVVIELKVCELRKEHIGQIQVYMNYIDCNLRKFDQDKTIGIIICKEDNKYVIKYCSDNRIIARAYKLI